VAYRSDDRAGDGLRPVSRERDRGGVLFAGAFGHVPRARLVGLVAHALLAVATAPLTLIVGIGAWTAVLVAIAIADTIQAGDRAPSS
jgi:hypothetical protein